MDLSKEEVVKEEEALNEEFVYIPLTTGSKGGMYCCDGGNHLATRDGTEWSCRTCFEMPIRGAKHDGEIVAYGFDICNECYEDYKDRHEHKLEQGFKS